MKNESRSLVAEGKHAKLQIFMPSIDTCHGHEALALEVSAKVSNGFRSPIRRIDTVYIRIFNQCLKK